jgi:restriction system protein
MVRAGDNNELADLVEEKRAVAIGWSEVGDVSALSTLDQFKQRYRDSYYGQPEARVNVNASQLYRFAREIGEGDYILTYIKASRDLLIGVAHGGYQYLGDLFPASYTHVRRVEWLKRVSRDDFSGDARNSMGSSLTVFNLDSHLPEIHQSARSTGPGTPEEEGEPPFIVEVTAKASELIADLVSRLDPFEFQDLVAGVLRTMGFRAISSQPGPDRGVDIEAYPDPLGFGAPRIKAQVKHRQAKVTGPEMNQFVGSLHTGENGLFVSTGGFTGEAESRARESGKPITMLDRDDFIRVLLEHYECLEPEYKAQIPLKRVWLPTE